MAVRSKGLIVCAALSASLIISAGALAQQVTVTRDAKLHAEPNASAAVVTELKQGANAEVTAKKGAWVQVKSDAGTGWTFSFNVNYGSTAPAAAAPTPQRRTSTSTIGIRGLEEEDLKAAKFDGKQLDALDSFAQDTEPAAAKRKGKGR